MISDAEHHRAKIRQFIQEPPDEPTYCELKQTLAYASNSEKAELVKDIASFSNTPLEHYGSYGYLIFGVAQEGDIPGLSDPLSGDPPSDIRNLLNKYLDRTVEFEFVSTHVEVGNQKRKVAAVVIPNSRRRPHIISRELQEQEGKKTKFLLREGEFWVRKAGGRQLATAEDIDDMYEARIRSAARDAAEPLKLRIDALESELAELRSASPILHLGVAMPGERESVKRAPARTVKQVLFSNSKLADLESELNWANSQAEQKQQLRNRGSFARLGTAPSAQDYIDYMRNLKDWLAKLDDFFIVEIELSNTGEVPAEDVYVEIEIPRELAAREELPEEKPERPADSSIQLMRRSPSPRYLLSKENAPEALIGPDLDERNRIATWEVGRLHHGRPVRTESDEEDVSGLLLARQPFEKLISERGFVDLNYTIRAANLRQPVKDTLRLLPAPTHG